MCMTRQLGNEENSEQELQPSKGAWEEARQDVHFFGANER